MTALFWHIHPSPAPKKDLCDCQQNATPTQTGPLQVIAANHMLYTAVRNDKSALFLFLTKHHTEHSMETCERTETIRKKKTMMMTKKTYMPGTLCFLGCWHQGAWGKEGKHYSAKATTSSHSWRPHLGGSEWRQALRGLPKDKSDRSSCEQGWYEKNGWGWRGDEGLSKSTEMSTWGKARRASKSTICKPSELLLSLEQTMWEVSRD